MNETQFDEIIAAIERGKSEGGTVIAGGERADDEGYLIAPTVFEGVGDDAFLSCEEVFGPVTSLYRFATLDEAIARANDSRVRPLGGDLHLEPGRGDALPERGAGGPPARQLADRGRRRARAVRRHQGERLRPARAGPRGDRVLHRDGHGLRRSLRDGSVRREPRRAERGIDDDEQRAAPTSTHSTASKPPDASRIAPSTSGPVAESV